MCVNAGRRTPQRVIIRFANPLGEVSEVRAAALLVSLIAFLSVAFSGCLGAAGCAWIRADFFIAVTYPAGLPDEKAYGDLSLGINNTGQMTAFPYVLHFDQNTSRTQLAVQSVPPFATERGPAGGFLNLNITEGAFTSRAQFNLTVLAEVENVEDMNARAPLFEAWMRQRADILVIVLAAGFGDASINESFVETTPQVFCANFDQH